MYHVNYSSVDFLNGIWTQIGNFGAEIESLVALFLEISTTSFEMTNEYEPDNIAFSAVALALLCNGIYLLNYENIYSSKCTKLLWNISKNAKYNQKAISLIGERHPTEFHILSSVDHADVESKLY